MLNDVRLWWKMFQLSRLIFDISYMYMGHTEGRNIAPLLAPNSSNEQSSKLAWLPFRRRVDFPPTRWSPVSSLSPSDISKQVHVQVARCDMRLSRIITDKCNKNKALWRVKIIRRYVYNRPVIIWSWFDVNQSTFDMTRKRFSHFRSQWPWPLIFRP